MQVAQAKTRKAVLNAHLQSRARLRESLGQVTSFVQEMVRASGYTDPFTIPEIPEPPEVTVALAGLGMDRLEPGLHESLENYLGQSNRWLIDCCNHLVEANLFGRITWAQEDPTVCEFTFYTHATNWTISRTHTAFIRTLHTHFLIEAESVPFRPIISKIPERFRKALLLCPPELEPEIKVVRGELFRKTTNEGEYKPREQLIKAVKPDPAIVFKDYVLAGWDE
jgi:hypothetical protein